MSKPPTPIIEKVLVQPAMEILREDYIREHAERPSAALLAQELYNRRESSAFTRHTKHSASLAHSALVQTERISLDAAHILRDWPKTLSPRTSLIELRDVLARSLRHLGATPQVIAMATTRDVPELPIGFWDTLAYQPMSCRFVVEAVLLRRCQFGAPVHKAIAQAWRTGVALLQNCLARPCLYAAAPTVWEGALQFAPSHIDVVRFGEIDDIGLPQPSSLPKSIVGRSFHYNALTKFVPATLDVEEPRWCESYPSDVIEFIQRADFCRDLARVSKCTKNDPASDEDWKTLLIRKHAVFRTRHALLQKSSTIDGRYLPEGLPRTFN